MSALLLKAHVGPSWEPPAEAPGTRKQGPERETLRRFSQPPSARRREHRIAFSRRRQTGFGANLPNRVDGSAGGGAGNEGRKPAPTHETFDRVDRTLHSRPCFARLLAQAPKPRRRQPGFRRNEAGALTGAPFSGAPGASKKPPEIPELAETFDGLST